MQALRVPLETSFTIWLAEQTSVLTAVVVNTSVDASGADRSMGKVLGLTSTLHRLISIT